jgi:hypothetical protein
MGVEACTQSRQNGEMGIRTRPVVQCPVCDGAGRVRHADLRDRACDVAGLRELGTRAVRDRLVLPRSAHVLVSTQVATELVHRFQLVPGRPDENDHARKWERDKPETCVRATGNFLGDAGNGTRVGDLLFRALEAAETRFSVGAKRFNAWR